MQDLETAAVIFIVLTVIKRLTVLLRQLVTTICHYNLMNVHLSLQCCGNVKVT